jgi:hypothetical protein
MRVAIPGTIAISMWLMACSDPGACTLSAEPGITVRVLDAATGTNITDGAHGTVTEGTYVDSLRPTEVDDTGRVQVLSAVYERPGTYDVFLERPGYQAVTRGGVRVTADECHVHTVRLDLSMVPLP